jgi:hypothetical protein
MERLEDYLKSVQNRFETHNYKLIRGVKLPANWTCDLVAAKTYFSWKGFIFLSQYIFFAHVERPTASDAQRLFEAGLQYCREGGDLPIRFRGMQAGGMIVPCLVAPSVDEAAIEFANMIPRKHWALFEFPVFHDLSSGATHYCRKKGIWGRLFYTDFHRLVAKCIVSERSSPA